MEQAIEECEGVWGKGERVRGRAGGRAKGEKAKSTGGKARGDRMVMGT